jgi:hypothetical protein
VEKRRVEPEQVGPALQPAGDWGGTAPLGAQPGRNRPQVVEAAGGQLCMTAAGLRGGLWLRLTVWREGQAVQSCPGDSSTVSPGLPNRAYLPGPFRCCQATAGYATWLFPLCHAMPSHAIKCTLLT